MKVDIHTFGMVTGSDVLLRCFMIHCSDFKMTAMMSFHATQCYHLVIEHEVSPGAYTAASVNSWSTVHSYLLI